jgi:DNA invertase Pin-like site-specific DNA recombinase
MRILTNIDELIVFTKKYPDWAKRIVICYIRVSTLEQAEEGYSLEAQKKYLTKYAAKLLFHKIFFFIDNESARRGGRRTEFNRMIEFYRTYADQNNCPYLVVEKTDRLTRNNKDDVILEDLIDGIGLIIHYVKENFLRSSANNAADKLLQDIRRTLARFVSENISEEVTKGMRAKAESGMWPSCVPIGYINAPGPYGKKIIIPDPVRAPIIKKMFEMSAYEKESIKSIYKFAVGVGLAHPRTNNPVCRNTIENILHNPLYAGYFYWDKVKYEGTYEPIISVDLFNDTQAALEGRAPHSSKKPPKKGNYTFSKLLLCAHCGYYMIGDKKKRKYIYYGCKGNPDLSCPGKHPYAKGEDVEKQAAESLKAISIDEEVLPCLVDALCSRNAKDRQFCKDAVISLKAKLDDYEQQEERLIRMHLKNRIDEKRYDSLLEEISEGKRETESSIQAYDEINPEKLEDGIRLFELVQESVNIYKNQKPEVKRKILQIVCSNLEWRDGMLITEYRKPFDIIADLGVSEKRKKAASSNGNSLLSGWYPGRESKMSPLNSPFTPFPAKPSYY